ncbi:hypothetical protein BD779DRAFT_1553878 [Infundibulicybe gibba]|nr:hypothetical protein BD779DRAFT_1553878 [Infundibulicybe gibba]
MDCGESGMTSVQRVQMCVSRMEQAAIVAHVFGLIQHSKVALCWLGAFKVSGCLKLLRLVDLRYS